MLVVEEEVPKVLNTDDVGIAPAQESHALIMCDGCEEAKAKDNNRDVLGEELAVETAEIIQGMVASNHKGLTRKALSEVLGLLNSRLWSLWIPNV